MTALGLQATVSETGSGKESGSRPGLVLRGSSGCFVVEAGGVIIFEGSDFVVCRVGVVFEGFKGLAGRCM